MQFEPLYNGLGFAMCLAAAASRALKSVMQDMLLSDGCVEPRLPCMDVGTPSGAKQRTHAWLRDKMHSLNLLAHMSPYAVAMLLPVVLLLEPGAVASAVRLATADRAFAVLLVLNCGVAACVNLSNFLVTQATSALTLQVLGKAKSVIAVAISLLLFRNPVTLPGMTGYAITLAGVAAYSQAKARARAAQKHGGAPVAAAEQHADVESGGGMGTKLRDD